MLCLYLAHVAYDDIKDVNYRKINRKISHVRFDNLYLIAQFFMNVFSRELTYKRQDETPKY